MATEFELRAALTIPSKALVDEIPGIITGHVFNYSDMMGYYQVYLFIDPRRSGHTFTLSDGIIPIMRVDWEFKSAAFESLTVDEIITRISHNIAQNLEQFESGAKEVEPATDS